MEFYTPSLKDVQRLKAALQDNEKRCCEMSLANSILWAKHYKTEIAFLEGNLIYRSRLDNQEYSYSCNLLNALQPKVLFEQLVEIAHNGRQPLRLHCMMKEEIEWIKQWYPERYQIIFDRDSSDYIYLQEKLASLAGKKLHAKRNHIHRFEEQNPDWQYERITAQNEEECVEMAVQWCLKNCVNEGKQVEYDKVDESKLVVYAIRHREELGMIGGVLRTAGKIIAITLGEPLTQDTFVVHFEKAFSEIQGAYPMINREFVRNELADYLYVNREEDMGLEGLRKAKLSYRPDILLDKGVVTEII